MRKCELHLVSKISIFFSHQNVNAENNYLHFLGIRLKEKVEPFQPMDKKDSHRRTEEVKKKLSLGKNFR